MKVMQFVDIILDGSIKLFKYAFILILFIILAFIAMLFTRPLFEDKPQIDDWIISSYREPPIGSVEFYMNNDSFEILTTGLLYRRRTAKGTYEFKNDSIFLYNEMDSYIGDTFATKFPEYFGPRFGSPIYRDSLIKSKFVRKKSQEEIDSISQAIKDGTYKRPF